MKVVTEDGWSLDVRVLAPPGEAKGVAVLGHAMMVDRRSMDRPEGAGFASALAARGWEVWLADLRGHGRSGPTPREGGSWTYDQIIALDLPALVAAAWRRSSWVWVVGHSLAGHASIAAAATGLYARPPSGHVLLAANTWQPSLEPSFWMRRKKGAAVAGFWLVRHLFGGFPSRRLGVGPADEPGPYVADIVDTWRRGWRSRDGRHRYFERMGEVTGPVLNVVGRADRLYAHPDGARRWTARIPGAEFWLVGEGDRGLGFDPDHMSLVTDPRAAPLWEAIGGWMDGASIPPDPSILRADGVDTTTP